MQPNILHNSELKDGINLLSKGDIKEAKVFFEEREAQGKLLDLINYYLALIYGQENNWSESIRRLESAIEINPELLPAREKLLALLFNLKRWPEALAQAEFLIATEPDSLSTLETAAFIHRQLGESEKAKGLLERALALAPDKLELATALAGFADGDWRNPWPEIDTKSATPLSLSAVYDKFWSNIKSNRQEIKIIKALSSLNNPENEIKPQKSDINTDDSVYRFEKNIGYLKDLKGLNILFGPTVIAGVSPRIARYFKSKGINAQTYDMLPSYLDYKVDFKNNDRSISGLNKFSDIMLQKAMDSDVICLDFGCSLKHLPFLGVDLRHDKTKNIPYSDLLFLKSKNKKIICFFWGSDCFSQSYMHYYYLKFLGIDKLPKPVPQTRYQFQLISILKNIADCFIAPPYFMSNLPQVVPFWDICLEPEIWPQKTEYTGKITKILTSITSNRKKNNTILKACIDKIGEKYGQNYAYSVQNKPYSQVPSLYANADLGLEQATNSFGLLCVEMMAIGLPVIANFHMRSYGSNRVEAPILSYNNIYELYNKIDECINNPSIMCDIGKKSRDYAMTYHTSEVQGLALSKYINQLIFKDKSNLITSKDYNLLVNIFNKKPEEVENHLYYDISVPLFCMLSEYEYAKIDCQEAITNGYKIDKFKSFNLAITKYLNQKDYDDEINKSKSSNLDININLVFQYVDIMKSSKKLIDEASFWMNKYDNI
jgi:tetratricopeptide (TPR) repeat protein